MSSRLLAVLLLFTLLLAITCGGDGDGPSSKLKVVATTTQIGDFVRNVGGDRVTLTVLLKPNQDAHAFEPEPSQLRRLAQAGLVLRNGIGLDAFVNKTLAASSAKVAVVTQGLSLRAGAEKEAAKEGDAQAGADATGKDPHVWLSVKNASRMVETIRDALSGADSANAAFYRDNATKYLASLDDLDRKIRAQVESLPIACRKLITNHDVLGYFADEYGFTIVGSVIPSLSTEAQPSALDVADIVKKIRAEKVPAIFAEASGNPGLIRQVGREANVKVVDDLYGDSLGPKGSGGATYIGMMETNTKKIVEALKGCS